MPQTLFRPILPSLARDSLLLRALRTSKKRRTTPQLLAAPAQFVLLSELPDYVSLLVTHRSAPRLPVFAS
jgi:hypothetical protein